MARRLKDVDEFQRWFDRYYQATKELNRAKAGFTHGKGNVWKIAVGATMLAFPPEDRKAIALEWAKKYPWLLEDCEVTQFVLGFGWEGKESRRGVSPSQHIWFAAYGTPGSRVSSEGIPLERFNTIHAPTLEKLVREERAIEGQVLKYSDVIRDLTEAGYSLPEIVKMPGDRVQALHNALRGIPPNVVADVISVSDLEVSFYENDIEVGRGKVGDQMEELRRYLGLDVPANGLAEMKRHYEVARGLGKTTPILMGEQEVGFKIVIGSGGSGNGVHTHTEILEHGDPLKHIHSDGSVRPYPEHERKDLSKYTQYHAQCLPNPNGPYSLSWLAQNITEPPLIQEVWAAMADLEIWTIRTRAKLDDIIEVVNGLLIDGMPTTIHKSPKTWMKTYVNLGLGLRRVISYAFSKYEYYGIIKGSFERKQPTTTGVMIGTKGRRSQWWSDEVEETDCGTEKCKTVLLTEENFKNYLYRYSWRPWPFTPLVLLTPENIKSYIGAKLQIRSPMFCEHKKACDICTGRLGATLRKSAEGPGRGFTKVMQWTDDRTFELLKTYKEGFMNRNFNEDDIEQMVKIYNWGVTLIKAIGINDEKYKKLELDPRVTVEVSDAEILEAITTPPTELLGDLDKIKAAIDFFDKRVEDRKTKAISNQAKFLSSIWANGMEYAITTYGPAIREAFGDATGDTIPTEQLVHDTIKATCTALFGRFYVRFNMNSVGTVDEAVERCTTAFQGIIDQAFTSSTFDEE